jgi:hypothetical protein
MTARDKYLKKKYGITEKDYNSMLKAQKGVCAICKREPKEGKNFSVDHDHKTKVVRGLLCFFCNKYRVGRHTRETIGAVYEYLMRPIALGLKKKKSDLGK